MVLNEQSIFQLLRFTHGCQQTILAQSELL
ncbi:Uncharacterised protein [Vibrio cholerae]|nr:Uncharacterised protein [Vibrio cholerae]